MAEEKDACPFCGKHVGLIGIHWKAKYGLKGKIVHPEWKGKKMHINCESEALNQNGVWAPNLFADPIWLQQMHKGDKTIVFTSNMEMELRVAVQKAEEYGYDIANMSESHSTFALSKSRTVIFKKKEQASKKP